MRQSVDYKRKGLAFIIVGIAVAIISIVVVEVVLPAFSVPEETWRWTAMIGVTVGCFSIAFGAKRGGWAM